MSYFTLPVVLLPLGMVGKEDIYGYPDDVSSSGFGGGVLILLILLYCSFRICGKVYEKIDEIKYFMGPQWHYWDGKFYERISLREALSYSEMWVLIISLVFYTLIFALFAFLFGLLLRFCIVDNAW